MVGLNQSAQGNLFLCRARLISSERLAIRRWSPHIPRSVNRILNHITCMSVVHGEAEEKVDSGQVAK